MEKWTPRAEYLSELHHLRNHLIAQLAEVDMAIMRENNAFDAKRAKTVTQQTQELLNRSRHFLPTEEPTPISYAEELRAQAAMQDDAKQTNAPYLHLIQ